MVRVISWGFPAAALEHEAEARAWVRLELLIVSVISWPLVPPAIIPELPMTWLRSWEPARFEEEQRSAIQLISQEAMHFFFIIFTCGVLLRQTSHCDLSRCDGGGLQGKASQRVDDDISRHWGVGGGHELAARVGDKAGVDTEGLGEKPALL